MDSSISIIETGGVNAALIRELHLASQAEFIKAGRNFLSRAIKIGELLTEERGRLLRRKVEFYRREELHAKANELDDEIATAAREGRVCKIVDKEFSEWFEAEGLSEIFSARTAQRYTQIYREREQLEDLGDIRTLAGALAILQTPKPAVAGLIEEKVGGKDEGDDEEEENETPIKRIFKGFWRWAEAKKEWADDERNEFVHDLSERQKFATEKGWLAA